ncbi:eukaryotic translation initiation factor SUI1 family protein [Actinidia rufa]|uniref:Eukaryotic translation initiation factor SUI1 family protein n=1 Tax=Actinidia rufa TaxID=165716 RepID=A0A7J0DMH6_9ERIC|nr:eukaryotic translation initiation factor SUI1 family protein [Actinidia rufa]
MKACYVMIYALWTIPELLPAFMLKGSEVSRFVIGGADLMFPGIYIPTEGLPSSFLAGEPWAVKVPGNPAPIAVGTTTMSSTEAIKAGLRGKALRITHSYRDSLWGSVEDHFVPNSGFLENVVFEDPSLSSCQTSDSCEADRSIDQQNGISSEVVGEAGNVAYAVSDQDPSSTACTDSKNDIAERVVADVGDLKLLENVSTDELNVEDQHTLSTEDIDAILDKCLLQALHTTVKDKDLPIPGMVANLPENRESALLSWKLIGNARPNLVGNALPTVNRRRGLWMCEICLKTDMTRLDLARLASDKARLLSIWFD